MIIRWKKTTTSNWSDKNSFCGKTSCVVLPKQSEKTKSEKTTTTDVSAPLSWAPFGVDSRGIGIEPSWWWPQELAEEKWMPQELAEEKSMPQVLAEESHWAPSCNRLRSLVSRPSCPLLTSCTTSAGGQASTGVRTSAGSGAPTWKKPKIATILSLGRAGTVMSASTTTSLASADYHTILIMHKYIWTWFMQVNMYEK